MEATGANERAPNPHAESVRTLAAAMLRTGLWLGGAAVLVALVAAAALAGWRGLAGAAVGAALGFASSLVTIGIMRLTAPLPVQALFGAVLGSYLIKVMMLLVVAMPLRGVAHLHPTALAFSVLGVVFAWVAAEVIAFRRTPIPTIIPAGTG